MAVKNRNPWFVVVVSFFTAYIYGIYWFYRTREELNELTGKGGSALLSTIGLFIPLVNLYVLWRYSADLETASKKSASALTIFVLWIIFLPIAQYLIQKELNKLAK